MKTMLTTASLFRATALAAGFALPIGGAGTLLCSSAAAFAQAPAASMQRGTVKSVSGSNLTVATDSGAQLNVTVADGARVQLLPPGSTDLKAAQPSTLGDIAVGDRVLVVGKAADDGGFGATRLILMKSADIAELRQKEQADWQKRGSGGLVTTVDAGSGAVTVKSGAKSVQVQTSAKTKFRRYSGDSVKFEDAKPGTLSQIQTGDQIRVLGDRSEDGSSIQAEIIVSGTFKNLAGTIASINSSANSFTIKDLATKKTVTVAVTSNSEIHKLPERAAAMLAARAHGGGAPGGAPSAGGAAPAARPASGGDGASGSPRGPEGGAGRPGGSDLSQMLARFPTETLADLKTGDAVMIVASQPEGGSSQMTAVTMLSGVEPILAANPSGAPAMTLSPWSVGGAVPEAQ
jgi:hypothetical protein